MSKKSVAILAGAAFLASVSLYAQEAETKTESEVDEDVITVTASKIDEDISKTTEKVQVITGEMIEQSGSHTLNEVLNSVPGMSFIGKTVGNSEPHGRVRQDSYRRRSGFHGRKFGNLFVHFDRQHRPHRGD